MLTSEIVSILLDIVLLTHIELIFHKILKAFFNVYTNKLYLLYFSVLFNNSFWGYWLFLLLDIKTVDIDAWNTSHIGLLYI